jgi:hypothetical protein
MRTTTLRSYPYKQYEDDDDIQALFKAYNDATQVIVDWFNETPLAYYPALTGDLLNWVVAGLYGLRRTQLASPLSPALGPLNTLVPLNSLFPLNTFVPPVQTFYNLTDDVFQRILTWNFFKGDSRRFSMQWLKRRVIRFLLGTNGIDPQPQQADFVIGTETTSAIGVVIAANVCTVSIDQSLLSLQAPSVTPGILKLFKLAFEGGNLELPLRYTYAVSIITNFVALIRPGVLSSNLPVFTQTVGPAIVAVLGGTGIYTYAWTWQSGGAGIAIDSPAAISTTFTAAGMAWGESRSGVALCTVTDTVSSLTATAVCEVFIVCELPSQLLIEGTALPLLTEDGAPIVVEP